MLFKSGEAQAFRQREWTPKPVILQAWSLWWAQATWQPSYFCKGRTKITDDNVGSNSSPQDSCHCCFSVTAKLGIKRQVKLMSKKERTNLMIKIPQSRAMTTIGQYCRKDHLQTAKGKQECLCEMHWVLPSSPIPSPPILTKLCTDDWD